MAVYKRFTIQQKYLNGVAQDEYRLGMEYDPKAYHSMENCESGTECTQVEYRWIDVEGEYFCEDTTKYAKQKRQQKCVDEDEWVDMYPYQYQKGEKMEEESEDCGAQPKWTTLTIGATPNSISQSFYDGLIVTPSKERYDFTDTVQIKLPTISGNVLSNVNYGSTMAYGQTTNSSVLNLTMSNNWYVQANYRPIQSYYLGVGILGNGSVIVTPDNEDRMYVSGTNVTLIPIASEGNEFKNWQYGPTTAYGSTTTNPQLDLTMSQSWYALASFGETETSEGLLYYLYSNGSVTYYTHNRSYLSKVDYNGTKAISIIDYSGVIKTLSESAFVMCYSLQYIDFPMCSYVGSNAFASCTSLNTISLPMCEYLDSWAFYRCSKLQSIGFPMCEYLGKGAFYLCSKLESIDFPMCSYVGSNAFEGCRLLTSIELPMCKYLGDRAFASCPNLSSIYLPVCSYVGTSPFNTYLLFSSIDLPMCEYLGSWVFMSWTNLSSINLPICSYVGSGAFESCISMESIELPMCKYLGDRAFLYCSSLKSIELPICEYIGERAFEGCYILPSINLPMCSYVGSYAFGWCTMLSSVYLPVCSDIDYVAFWSCRQLQTIEIGTELSNVCSIYDIDIFKGTKITSTTGSILVPASLVDAYKTDNKWSYFSNRIFPIQ